MEQLKSLADLLDLQEIDLKIDKLLDRRSSLPELDQYKVAHAEVARLEAALEAGRGILAEADSGLHKTNGELEITAEKAAGEQNRLYAGGLSARDADYLRREVELLYAKVSKMEDEVLGFLEDKEAAEADVDRLTEELDIAAKNKDALATSIADQWRLIDKELAAKEERKKINIELVDEYLLETYDSLRDSSGGRVVGRLADGVCGACHLRLSAAEESKVKKEDPPRCIHCRSILVI
ncbi:MAG: zinc ribbon domain-containing protein [Acidimicrobiia bacterium]